MNKKEKKALALLLLSIMSLSGCKKEVEGSNIDLTPENKALEEPKISIEEVVEVKNTQEELYEVIKDNNELLSVQLEQPVEQQQEELIETTVEETNTNEDGIIIRNDIVRTTTGLNFRQTPSTDQKELFTFPQGMELKVIGEAPDNWLIIDYNGTIGYVKKDYTVSYLEELKQKMPHLNIDSIEVEKIVYPKTGLNLRTEPNTNCEVVKELESLEAVKVLKDYDDWYLVMTNEHEFGFVNKEYTKELTELFVEVDKSSQVINLYYNNELLLTSPVVTGKDSTPSDTGLFKIYSKERGRYLTDGKTYNTYVEYWMPYNGGEGLHDATWRSSFGGEIYHNNGSHGCINLPKNIADKIYGTVEVGTKVLVHK